MGGIMGGVAGAATAKNRTKGAICGTAVGAIGGAAVGSALGRQEEELRRDLNNDRVQINNDGNRLVVTLPQDILFATSSATVNNALRADLLTVAESLRKYPDTRVQVIGHTDSTGSAAYNQNLSERRAAAVAAVLIEGGVAPSRIQTIGRGETQPIASNQTPEGRAQNRRVEIVILPTT
jgi:outer membrane protein OmpA-like peptidoglycan-associated protein